MAWHLIETQASGKDMAMKKAVWTQGAGLFFPGRSHTAAEARAGREGAAGGAEAGARALLFPAVSLCRASMTWPLHTPPGQQAWKELLHLFTKMDDDLR